MSTLYVGVQTLAPDALVVLIYKEKNSLSVCIGPGLFGVVDLVVELGAISRRLKKLSNSTMDRNGILKQYSWLLSPRHFLINAHKIPLFLFEVKRQGKLAELASFLLWEIRYRLGLGKNKYLKFTSAQPCIITDFFPEQLQCFGVQNIAFRKEKINWKVLIRVNACHFGTTHEAPDTLLHVDPATHQARTLYKFSSPVSSLFVCSSEVLLISLMNGTVFRSESILDYRPDHTHFSITHSLNLSNAASYIRRNYAITETPDHLLLLGEYGNVHDSKRKWISCAYVYTSKDQGITWTRSDFLIRQGINKHVHILAYSKLINALILTDGDNKKKTWIGTHDSNHRDPVNWRLVNRFHYQTGGHLSIAETSAAVFLGTDYLGGTNSIVQTKDGKFFTRQVIKSPYRRCPVYDLQTRSSYFQDKPMEVWALLYNQRDRLSKGLLMFSTDNGASWNKVIEFNATKYELSISSSGENIKNEIFLTVRKLGLTSSENTIKTYVISDKHAPS